jgi:class 3 adenylate cyclase
VSFRTKILLALVLLAGGLVTAALVVAQWSVAGVQRATAAEAFERDVAFVAALQSARLAGVRAKCLELARSVRLIAALEEDDPSILYRIALDELRDVVRPATARDRPASFFRLLAPDGRVLRPDDERAGLLARDGALAHWEQALARAGTAAPGTSPQEIGYLAPEVDGAPVLHEVVLTRMVDPVTSRVLGTLVLGFRVDDPGEEGSGVAPIRTGLWLEGRLYSRTIPAALAPELATMLDAPRDDEHVVDVGGVPHRVFVRPIEGAPGLPAAHQVGLHSLAPALAAEARVRRVVLVLGALALLFAAGAGVAVARGLAQPVRALVKGARKIERGQFDVRVPVRRRDELGQLGIAFNEMAAGLATKERYRRMLDMVADKRVADELLAGRVTLAGEMRDVSVLFCDVCGFTALTEPMAPTEVIALLNAHMETMTEIVHAHGGIVDKFIGDGLMALFGAPSSNGHDADAAVAAARAMIAARRTANETTAHPIDVHVGIATGSVVAGCLGSTNRLDYTVLGARVNLAARLCGEAGPMEIVLDAGTRERLESDVDLEALPALALKGFRAAVAAYRVRDVADPAKAV